MPSIKFQHNLTPWRPFWISERNDFRNSVPLCHCDASHQVSAQSVVALSDIGTILATLNLCVTVMLPIKFRLNPIFGCRYDMSFEEFQDCRHGGHRISEPNDFSCSEFPSRSDAFHQVSARSDLWFRRCHFKNFKMAAVTAILNIGTEQFQHF